MVDGGQVIEVKHTSGCITVSGHAGYAPIGQDIVCAGVSTLVQTLIASISEMTTDEVQYDMQPGSVEIMHGKLSDKAQILIDSFLIGIRMISETYPAYVRIFVE